jgi:hypothetical protein
MLEYLKSLELQKSLLLANNEPLWADWIEKDLDAWKASESTEHHLDAFGGAGSYNDINLHYGEKVGYWKNALLSNLASISYVFAKERIFKFPNNSVNTLDGVACQNCGRKEVNEDAIERFLAGKFVPVFIKEYFSAESFKDLLEFDKLLNDRRVQELRESTKQQILQAGANLNLLNNAWSESCISCSSTGKTFCEFTVQI